ncbi:hypothetical protein JCM18899A_13910 [Nocardioides sp. AN3]
MVFESIAIPEGAPEVADVQAYLASVGMSQGTLTDAELEAVLYAEIQDQLNRLRIHEYTYALLEAACRRVARNLAVRPLPLGVQPTVSDAGVVTAYIGSSDPEVRRLEAPYRKRSECIG